MRKYCLCLMLLGISASGFGQNGESLSEAMQRQGDTPTITISGDRKPVYVVKPKEFFEQTRGWEWLNAGNKVILEEDGFSYWRYEDYPQYKVTLGGDTNTFDFIVYNGKTGDLVRIGSLTRDLLSPAERGQLMYDVLAADFKNNKHNIESAPAADRQAIAEYLGIDTEKVEGAPNAKFVVRYIKQLRRERNKDLMWIERIERVDPTTFVVTYREGNVVLITFKGDGPFKCSYTAELLAASNETYLERENRMDVDEFAAFPDGKKGQYQFLRKKSTYPKKLGSLTGAVTVAFVVEKDGTTAEVSEKCGVVFVDKDKTYHYFPPKVLEELKNRKALPRHYYEHKYSNALKSMFDATINLVEAMPKWHPATRDGQPTRSHETFSMSYSGPE